MPYGGEFSARSPGEARVFSFDFNFDLASGDYIASVTSSVVSVYSGTDPNAAALAVGSPSILTSPVGGLQTVVAQLIGVNANNLAGFLADVTYTWTIKVLTHNGETPVWNVRIPVLGQ